MSEITPFMAQYYNIKQNYPNEILFFRLGDFYEMFDDDAKTVSKLLNLTLTHRLQMPMCGIPYHAAKIYIARLLRMGKKIAICEQIGDPKAKGLTERKVVEVITPGNVTDEEYLDGATENFLASICFFLDGKRTFVSYSYIDVSTGDFFATHWDFADFDENFKKELGRTCPREIIVSQSVADYKNFDAIMSFYPNIAISVYPDWHFAQELSVNRLKKQFASITLRSFSLTENSPEIASSGFLLEYIIKNTGASTNGVLPHVKNLVVYSDSQYLVIDDSSRRNLEITANLHDNTSAYSLLETISNTNTPMGKRLLRNYLMYPLTDIKQILERQNHVKVFYDNPLVLTKARSILANIYDIERLAARVALEKAHPKDLQTLKLSLANFVEIQKALSVIEFPLIETDTARAIVNLIDSAIIDDPPIIINDGGYIKPGYSEELDHLHEIHDNFHSILENYLEEEKQNTGIANLKIRFNTMSGYFIEVTKGKLQSVPNHFILKRTLVNGDRYTTLRLQELENELVNASAQIVVLEKRLYFELRQKITQNLNYLMQVSHIVSYVDVSASLAQTALAQNWVQPEITSDNSFAIENGRHPVVEYHLKSGEFVPNDVDLTEKNFALVTGPNMAGKSTFLRQNALIVLLAQIGSFVPATKAKIGIVDKIFCRVGASDNLARGESTFLVEMSETALILRSATQKSLVIMDEVGRGTSTEDGLSLCQAICEYLLQTIKAKTLFATHFHQLTRMIHPNLQQLCMDVLDSNGEIVFLRKVIHGSAENSYGLHVARLAGIPSNVIDRAQKILDALVKNSNIYTDTPSLAANENNNKAVDFVMRGDISPNATNNGANEIFSSPNLFSDEEMVLDSILSTNVDSITPLQALSQIAEWKKMLTTPKICSDNKI